MGFLTLNWSGVVLSVVMGVLLVVFGGLGLGYFFLLAMLVFLVLSAIVTQIGMRYKKSLKVGQRPRGVRNVLANGMPPMIMALLFYLSNISGNASLSVLFLVGFLASVGAITADKFSSEVGVLSLHAPRMIFTWKKVKKGTSGGMSPMGLAAGAIAALLVSLLVFMVAGQIGMLNGSRYFSVGRAFIAVLVAGFLGSLVDSALGYYEEKGIGNKFTSNFVCGIVAGFAAILLFMIL